MKPIYNHITDTIKKHIRCDSEVKIITYWGEESPIRKLDQHIVRQTTQTDKIKKGTYYHIHSKLIIFQSIVKHQLNPRLVVALKHMGRYVDNQ